MKYLVGFILTLFLLLLLMISPKILYASEYIIEMTQGKFVPQNLAIKIGDTTTFVNKDEVDRWPASNIHPTHGIYPEFDPKKAVKPGDSWKFQFQRARSFKFHDHLNPSLGGTIIVSGEGAENSQKAKFNLAIFLKKIYYKIFPGKLEADLKTFDAVKIAPDQERLEYWISLIGGQKFMDKLVADSGGGSKVDCHQEAHYVGRIAFKLEGKGVFKKPDYSCHSGYLHGAMEAFIAQVGQKDLISEVSKLCSGFSTNFSNFECLHGIGHGLMAYEDYDIPAALGLCKKLGSDYQRSSCYGGIFMENIMVDEGRGAVAGHKTNWVSSDPQFPCSGVDQDYHIQFECYQMQTSRMLHMFNYNFSLIAEECLKTPKNMTQVCFRSMGRDVAGQTLRDPEKIVNLCKTTPTDYFRSCIRGALNVIIDFWGENLSDQAGKLCDRLSLNDKNYCFGLLGNRLKDVFGKDVNRIKKVCSFSDQQFRSACLI